MLYLIWGPAAYAVSDDSLRLRFLSSLETEKEIVVHLIDKDPRTRALAINQIALSPYREHVSNYLAYYGSLNNYDLFQGILDQRQVRELEKLTRTEYQRLLRELFGRNEIDGPLFFRFFMEPQEFFRKDVNSKIQIASGAARPDIPGFVDRSTFPWGRTNVPPQQR